MAVFQVGSRKSRVGIVSKMVNRKRKWGKVWHMWQGSTQILQCQGIAWLSLAKVLSRKSRVVIVSKMMNRKRKGKGVAHTAYLRHTSALPLKVHHL